MVIAYTDSPGPGTRSALMLLAVIPCASARCARRRCDPVQVARPNVMASRAPVELLCREVMMVRCERGIVGRYIPEPAEFGDGLLDRGRILGRIGGIGLYRHRLPPFAVTSPTSFSSIGGRGRIGECHRGTVGGQSSHDLRADAARASVTSARLPANVAVLM